MEKKFCVKNGIILGASRHLEDAMNICTSVGTKNREEIGMFWFEEGGKIGSFGQNIYTCPRVIRK